MSTNYYETAAQEDLDCGYGTVTKEGPGGGGFTGTQINLKTFALGQVQHSKSWTPGAIANGASVATDVTVTGAAGVNDYAMATYNKDLQGCSISAHMNGVNECEVVISNLTGASVTPTAGAVKVLVFRVA